MIFLSKIFEEWGSTLEASATNEINWLYLLLTKTTNTLFWVYLT